MLDDAKRLERAISELERVSTRAAEANGQGQRPPASAWPTFLTGLTFAAAIVLPWLFDLSEPVGFALGVAFVAVAGWRIRASVKRLRRLGERGGS